MLDTLDSVDMKCGTDNFTAMKQFIDLITGDDIAWGENITINYVQLFMNAGLKSRLKESSAVARHSFEYLFGALPYDICLTPHSQYCTECDDRSDMQLSLKPVFMNNCTAHIQCH